MLGLHGDVTPFGVTPRIKTYMVAGTFKIGMSEYDQTYVFMPLAEAQLFFNTGETVNGLETMVADPDQIDNLVLPIARAAGPYVRVATWKDMNSTFFGAIQTERNVMFLILTLIILVAALNIVSGLYMLVKDKSDPRLYRCVIHDGHKEGLQIVASSEGRFEQCEFFANTLAGVSVNLRRRRFPPSA